MQMASVRFGSLDLTFPRGFGRVEAVTPLVCLPRPDAHRKILPY